MKKKVDVYCGKAFRIGNAAFAGRCMGVILAVEDIRTCLLNKALVWELADNGKRIPLDFTNYTEDNGGVVGDKETLSYDSSYRETPVTKISFKPKEDETAKEEPVIEEPKQPVKKTEVITEIKSNAVVKDEKKEDTKKENTSSNNNRNNNQQNNKKHNH